MQNRFNRLSQSPKGDSDSDFSFTVDLLTLITQGKLMKTDGIFLQHNISISNNLCKKEGLLNKAPYPKQRQAKMVYLLSENSGEKKRLR